MSHSPYARNCPLRAKIDILRKASQYLLFFCLSLAPLHADTPPAAETKIIACDNGLEMFGWTLEFIRRAEQSIEFAPCLTGGTLFHEVMQTIETQMHTHPDLTVSILLVPTFLEPPDHALLERLQRDYSEQLTVTFATSTIDVSRDLVAITSHVKMLVVDETYFTMGGSNLDAVICSEGTEPISIPKKPIPIGKQLPSGARDQDIVGRGPVATAMRRQYYLLEVLWKEYQSKKRFASSRPEDYEDKSAWHPIDLTRHPYSAAFETSPQVVDVPTEHVVPLFGEPGQTPNQITEAYCRLIDAAQEEILIGNVYIAPVEAVMDSLMRASRRGVRITTITNGIHEVAPPYTKHFSWANRIHYVPLLYGKGYSLWDKQKCQHDPLCPAHIYEYYVKDVLYHKKVMIVDRQHFLIGSYNLGIRSDLGDYEFVMVIDSKPLAEKALFIFARDVAHSIEVSAEQARDWYFDYSIHYLAEIQKLFHALL